MSYIPKFRAWHKELKVMAPVMGLFHMSISGSEQAEVKVTPWLDESGMYCRDRFFWKFSEIELMQWSGFKTSTGQDIYESDILASYIRPEIIYVVKMLRGAWLLCPVDEYYPTEDMISNDRMSFAIIKGNIYQNGELLNVSNPS